MDQIITHIKKHEAIRKYKINTEIVADDDDAIFAKTVITIDAICTPALLEESRKK